MLQIEIQEQDGEEQEFILRGEICSCSVPKLMECWSEYRMLRAGKYCIVNLAKVSLIDCAGERAIRRIAQDGARFLAHGPLMERIIDLVCKVNVDALRDGQREFRSMVYWR